MIPSLLLAALAAACNAVSSVMQRKANRDEPAKTPFGPKLLGHVLRRPSWLVGFGAMLASFLCQALALAMGPLAAVEPVLVLELPMTLFLAARLLQVPLHRRDWVAASGMAAGLALMIATLAPSGGTPGTLPAATVMIAAAVTVGAVGVVVAAGALLAPARAALFGAAAGAGFGFTASLLKIAVTRLGSDGVVALMTDPATYATMAAGIGSLLLVQAALHAGTLVAAQPGLTLCDPLVSVVWGTAVIGETTRTGPVLALAVVGGAAIVVSVIALARATGRADSAPGPGARDADADRPTAAVNRNAD